MGVVLWIKRDEFSVQLREEWGMNLGFVCWARRIRCFAIREEFRVHLQRRMGEEVRGMGSIHFICNREGTNSREREDGRIDLTLYHGEQEGEWRPKLWCFVRTEGKKKPSTRGMGEAMDEMGSITFVFNKVGINSTERDNGNRSQALTEEAAGTSSSEVSPETAGTTSLDVSVAERIGQISYDFSKIIGRSGNGTAVYEGSYEVQRVAVKSIPKSHVGRVDQEVQNFLAFGYHKNVVRYYGEERDKFYIYLALELCNCNLSDLIKYSSPDSYDQCELESTDFDHSTRSTTASEEDRLLEKLKNIFGDVKLWKEDNGRPTPVLLELMRDMVSGLVHLHKSGIVHRDLKPQNVLISKESSTLCAKLADLGISRRLSDGKNSLTNHNSSCGTTGWKAKEWLFHKRQTPAMDLFSLGCLLFFCITRGGHPFGDHDERNMNIKNDNARNLVLMKDFPEAFHLISLLLQADHELRPKAIMVLHHPLFWDARKRLSFLRDTSDRAKDSDLFTALESTAATTLGTEMIRQENVILRWNKKVGCEIISQLMLPYPEGYYDYHSVRHLLRLIQNIFDHYAKLLKDQITVGPLYEVFDDYFTSRFPMLLIEVYKVVRTFCQNDEYFKTYFEGGQ